MTFNQYLIVDDEPLLLHTGLRQLFPLVREAIDTVIQAERLRYISFSHYEADECGSLNEFLRIAPNAVPLCGKIAAIVSIGDVADRAPQAMDDGEVLSLTPDRTAGADPEAPFASSAGCPDRERA